MAILLEHEIRLFGLTEAEFRVLTTQFSQVDGVAHPNELCASAGSGSAKALDVRKNPASVVSSAKKSQSDTVTLMLRGFPGRSSCRSRSLQAVRKA
jgi:hypothetical protein